MRGGAWIMGYFSEREDEKFSEIFIKATGADETN
jgi:hypothetical protein